MMVIICLADTIFLGGLSVIIQMHLFAIILAMPYKLQSTFDTSLTIS